MRGRPERGQPFHHDVGDSGHCALARSVARLVIEHGDRDDRTVGCAVPRPGPPAASRDDQQDRDSRQRQGGGQGAAVTRLVRRSRFVVLRSRFVVLRAGSTGCNLNRQRRTFFPFANDRCDEREPAARERLDESGALGGIAERCAQLTDAVREPAIEVHVRAVGPEMRTHLLACDHIARARQEQRERPCRLRLERNRAIRSREDARPIVELEDPEPVCHLTGR